MNENQMNSKEIEGIMCKVSNCKYHATNNCCHAGHIVVGPGSTESSKGTECSTFEAK